jgi:signal transduction histidine kinase
MRRLIADLRPTTLDELGLGAALEALAERLEASGAIEVDLDLNLDFPSGRRKNRLASEIEDAAFRLAQEALNNAAQHAETDRASVEVTEDEENVRVRVSDEGDGFDPGVRTDGFGLVGMRERVTLAGGSLELQSAPGSGTTIVATLPARQRDKRDEQASREIAARRGPRRLGRTG